MFLREPHGLEAWVPGLPAIRIKLNLKLRQQCKLKSPHSHEFSKVKNKIVTNSQEVRDFHALAKRAKDEFRRSKESYGKRANANNFGKW